MAATGGIHMNTSTLVAATADTCTMTGSRGKNTPAELVHHGVVTDPIYFRLDGTAAVVAADENQVLLPNERLFVRLGEGNAISLISAGTPTYSVIVL